MWQTQFTIWQLNRHKDERANSQLLKRKEIFEVTYSI